VTAPLSASDALCFFIFAGSAPLQWRVFVNHTAHERDWSRALPAMTTAISIKNGGFAVNGVPTYAGRSWKGHRIEGPAVQQSHGQRHRR